MVTSFVFCIPDKPSSPGFPDSNRPRGPGPSPGPRGPDPQVREGDKGRGYPPVRPSAPVDVLRPGGPVRDIRSPHEIYRGDPRDYDPRDPLAQDQRRRPPPHQGIATPPPAHSHHQRPRNVEMIPGRMDNMRGMGSTPEMPITRDLPRPESEPRDHPGSLHTDRSQPTPPALRPSHYPSHTPDRGGQPGSRPHTPKAAIGQPPPLVKDVRFPPRPEKPGIPMHSPPGGSIIRGTPVGSQQLPPRGSISFGMPRYSAPSVTTSHPTRLPGSISKGTPPTVNTTYDGSSSRIAPPLPEDAGAVAAAAAAAGLTRLGDLPFDPALLNPALLQNVHGLRMPFDPATLEMIRRMVPAVSGSQGVMYPRLPFPPVSGLELGSVNNRSTLQDDFVTARMMQQQDTQRRSQDDQRPQPSPRDPPPRDYPGPPYTSQPMFLPHHPPQLPNPTHTSAGGRALTPPRPVEPAASPRVVPQPSPTHHDPRRAHSPAHLKSPHGVQSSVIVERGRDYPSPSHRDLEMEKKRHMEQLSRDKDLSDPGRGQRDRGSAPPMSHLPPSSQAWVPSPSPGAARGDRRDPGQPPERAGPMGPGNTLTAASLIDAIIAHQISRVSDKQDGSSGGGTPSPAQTHPGQTGPPPPSHNGPPYSSQSGFPPPHAARHHNPPQPPGRASPSPHGGSNRTLPPGPPHPGNSPHKPSQGANPSLHPTGHPSHSPHPGPSPHGVPSSHGGPSPHSHSGPSPHPHGGPSPHLSQSTQSYASQSPHAPPPHASRSPHRPPPPSQPSRGSPYQLPYPGRVPYSLLPTTNQPPPHPQSSPVIRDTPTSLAPDPHPSHYKPQQKVMNMYEAERAAKEEEKSKLSLTSPAILAPASSSADPERSVGSSPSSDISGKSATSGNNLEQAVSSGGGAGTRTITLGEHIDAIIIQDYNKGRSKSGGTPDSGKYWGRLLKKS